MYEPGRLITFVLSISTVSCSLTEPSRQEINQFTPADRNEMFCVIHDGEKNLLLIESALMYPDGSVNINAILVENGIIKKIGDLETLKSLNPKASVLSCTNALLSPGMVNAHEHLAYSYAYPDPSIAPIYSHRDEWRGVSGHPKPLEEVLRTADGKTLAWIELRHLVAGTTAVAGSGAVDGIVKNIADKNDPKYPLKAEMATFPFSRNATQLFENYSCSGNPPGLPAPKIVEGASRPAYVPHIAEGVNCTARLEMSAYLQYVEKGSERRYSLIHGIDASAAQIRELADKGISVVWSPRSNFALYGKTFDVMSFDKRGGSIAL